MAAARATAGSGLPERRLARWLFLRALGLVCLVAFVSLWVQVHGLVGSRGILPLEGALQAWAREGGVAWVRHPTVFWLASGDGALHAVCAAGTIAALAVALDVAALPALVLAWALYLSLAEAGQVFLHFQWDVLLLETGLVALFVVPRRGIWRRQGSAPPSRLGIWLLWWLLFRLMLASGVVKILSNDPVWWDLTALAHHYETQPLPTTPAWWAHQLPRWVQRLCCGLMFAIELGLPFLIPWPRTGRRVAAAGFALLMLAIALTGNYGFFNLLTLALCIALVDDGVWRRVLPARLVERLERPAPPSGVLARAGGWLAFPLALALLVVGALPTLRRFHIELPERAQGLLGILAPFRSVNAYGLFADMTDERPELVLEGSADGVDWTPYEFRWKPGRLDRAPGWAQPHMPRLDWQMWFAALGPGRARGWLQGLFQRLLEGEPSVLALLADDPFPAAPPRYVRALLYRYRFTTPVERRASGDYWARELAGVALGPASLR